MLFLPGKVCVVIGAAWRNSQVQKIAEELRKSRGRTKKNKRKTKRLLAVPTKVVQEAKWPRRKTGVYLQFLDSFLGEWRVVVVREGEGDLGFALFFFWVISGHVRERKRECILALMVMILGEDGRRAIWTLKRARWYLKMWNKLRFLGWDLQRRWFAIGCYWFGDAIICFFFLLIVNLKLAI